MKFNEMTYNRPDIAAVSAGVEKLAQQAQNAKDAQELLHIFEAYQRGNDALETAATLAAIRHTMDTRDEYYDRENDYFDENTPVYADKVLGLYRALLASPHKDALREAHGDILIEKLENAVKGSDERLVPLQQEENALATRYEKLYASARIPFMGKELNVAQLAPYKESTDRAVRRQAFEAEGQFFDAHREELDEIYDNMVKNRTQQAKTLGYDSFTPLGDIRMDRIGYTRAEIRQTRAAVRGEVVPAVRKLRETQAARIGVSDMKFFDTLLHFKDGNPTPKGTPAEILEAGQKMYRALAPETAAFIDFMMDGDLFDVLTRPGKAPGGYCTYIPQHKSPFIFSNFVGNAGDVDVLTHEAGHAFAAYVAAGKALPAELQGPGLESCEIHSMSMEFLTSEYHALFFRQDTDKYALSHAEEALYFMPYGCMVDEFQETIYNEPNLTPAQRNEFWLELERQYRPGADFDGLPFYARGAGWQWKMHIYLNPFYYIDYVLAQAIALQFFAAHNKDKQDAWQRYLALVDKAGTQSYPNLVHAAGFAAPFEGDSLRRTVAEVMGWLQDRAL